MCSVHTAGHLSNPTLVSKVFVRVWREQITTLQDLQAEGLEYWLLDNLTDHGLGYVVW